MTSAETPTPGDTGHVVSAPTISPTPIPAGSGHPSLVTGVGGAGLQVADAAVLHQTLGRALAARGAFTIAQENPNAHALTTTADNPEAVRVFPTADGKAEVRPEAAKVEAATAEAAKAEAKEVVATADRAERKALRKIGAKDLVKSVPKLLKPETGKAALISRKAVAALAPRLAGFAVPGLGVAIGTLLWCFDSSERKLFNDWIMRSHAPDLDAPPSPPRTNFLPLCFDGNRDPSIERMDQGMTQTNSAAFGYHPEDVWPQNAAIQTTPDFGGVIQQANKTISKTIDWADNLQSTMRGLNGQSPVIDAALEKTAPQVNAMGKLGETVLPKAGTALSEAAGGANDFYQKFREINSQNRQEINNTNSRIIPLFPASINEGKMSDSVAAAREALNKMNATSQKISQAADDWSIPAPTGTTKATDTAYTRPDAPSAPVSPAPAAPEKPGITPDQLKEALKGGETPQMPTMPQMPQMGGMPQMPTGGGMPGSGMPTATPETAPPADPNQELKDLLDKKAKDKGDEPGTELGDSDKDAENPEEKGDEVAHAVGATTPGGTPGEGGNPDDKPPVTEGVSPQSNTAEIGGKTRTFDSPKAAQMAHLLSMPGEGGGKTLEQAAAEAGYQIPSPDQDIGEQVDPSQIKPGDVIKSQPDSGMYLGDNEVITEAGEIKPLSEVMAGMDGAHQGIFRLPDDGAPAMQAGADTGPSTDSSMPSGFSSPAVGDATTGPNLDAGGVPGLAGTDNDAGIASGISESPQGIAPGSTPGGM